MINTCIQIRCNISTNMQDTYIFSLLGFSNIYRDVSQIHYLAINYGCLHYKSHTHFVVALCKRNAITTVDVLTICI